MDSWDGVQHSLRALKVRLANGEIEPERYRELREELLADLAPDDRARLSGVATATPPAGPSSVAGRALRTQPPALIELDLEPGTILFDQWCLRRELGRGGFGVVFEAEDRHLGEVQAVKILDPSMVAREDLLARFRREVRVMRGLQHRHIVRVYDYREDLDRYLALISMELIGAGSVAGLLAAAPPRTLRLPQVVAILRQTLSALAAAHAAGVIHRDVTPSNVLLAGASLAADPDAEPDVRLVDFGIAGMVETTELSQKSRVLGTAAYVAPEVLDPRAEITPAVDVYGVGAVAYELISGQTPLVTGYRPLGRIRDDVPPAIEALVMGMVAALPAERLSVAEALDRIDALSLGAPLASLPAALPDSAPPLPKSAPLASAHVPEPVPLAAPSPVSGAAKQWGENLAAEPRPRRPRMRLVSSLAGVVALVVAAVLWFGTRGEGEGVSEEAAPEGAPASLSAQVPASAQLEVRSNVAGDAVSIDGRGYGSTPLRVALAPGSYRIVVTKPGCERDERTIDLASAVSLVHRASLTCAASEPERTVAAPAGPALGQAAHATLAETPNWAAGSQPEEDVQPTPAPPPATGVVSVLFQGSPAIQWTDGKFIIGGRLVSFNYSVDAPTEVARLELPVGPTQFVLLENEIEGNPAVPLTVRPGRVTQVVCQAKGIVKIRVIISVDGQTLFDRDYNLDGTLKKINL